MTQHSFKSTKLPITLLVASLSAASPSAATSVLTVTAVPGRPHADIERAVASDRYMRIIPPLPVPTPAEEEDSCSGGTRCMTEADEDALLPEPWQSLEDLTETEIIADYKRCNIGKSIDDFLALGTHADISTLISVEESFKSQSPSHTIQIANAFLALAAKDDSLTPTEKDECLALARKYRTKAFSLLFQCAQRIARPYVKAFLRSSESDKDITAFFIREASSPTSDCPAPVKAAFRLCGFEAFFTEKFPSPSDYAEAMQCLYDAENFPPYSPKVLKNKSLLSIILEGICAEAQSTEKKTLFGTLIFLLPETV